MIIDTDKTQLTIIEHLGINTHDQLRALFNEKHSARNSNYRYDFRGKVDLTETCNETLSRLLKEWAESWPMHSDVGWVTLIDIVFNCDKGQIGAEDIFFGFLYRAFPSEYCIGEFSYIGFVGGFEKLHQYHGYAFINRQNRNDPLAAPSDQVPFSEIRLKLLFEAERTLMEQEGNW